MTVIDDDDAVSHATLTERSNSVEREGEECFATQSQLEICANSKGKAKASKAGKDSNTSNSARRKKHPKYKIQWTLDEVSRFL